MSGNQAPSRRGRPPGCRGPEPAPGRTSAQGPRSGRASPAQPPSISSRRNIDSRRNPFSATASAPPSFRSTMQSTRDTTSPNPWARSIARRVEAPVVTTSSTIATCIPGGRVPRPPQPLGRAVLLRLLPDDERGDRVSPEGAGERDGGHDRVRPERDAAHRVGPPFPLQHPAEQPPRDQGPPPG